MVFLLESNYVAYLQCRVRALLDDICGTSTEPVKFRTHSSEPDTPSAPKLTSRTKNSINLKWNVSLLSIYEWLSRLIKQFT